MKFFILMCLLASSGLQAATHYFVRHAEKDSSDPLNKNPTLSFKGQQRAQNLALLLSKANIKQIYSTAYKRTELTAKPLSEELKIPVAHYNPSHMTVFLDQLKSSKENTLVVGHSNTTTEAVSLLTGKTISGLSEHDYGDVFQVLIESDKTVITHFKLPPATAQVKPNQAIKTK